MNNIKSKDMTEQEVRRIAREESQGVFEKSIAAVTEQLAEVKKFSQQNQKTLARLERLLLGEVGINEEDTLKARATYAYQYAKHNSELQIVERAVPALDWFEDVSTPDSGETESRLERLGKMIIFYDRIKWILGLLGVTTLINAIPILRSVIDWIMSFN